MQTVLITGGTGTIGRRLTQLLLIKNYRVIILTRNIAGKTNTENYRYAEWNIGKQTIDRNALEEADFIIHLAGAGIADGRWTAKRKKVIVNSRVNGCRLIIKALKEIPNKVRVVISASAIGYYGQDRSPGHFFKEEDEAGNDFLAQTCKAWEEAIRPVTTLGKRLVILRTGVVLDNQDGAYREFEKSLQFRVATVLGKGDQVISWIHINDMCRVYLQALENPEMQGVYNSCAPNPVSNKQLVSLIAGHKVRNHDW